MNWHEGQYWQWANTSPPGLNVPAGGLGGNGPGRVSWPALARLLKIAAAMWGRASWVRPPRLWPGSLLPSSGTGMLPMVVSQPSSVGLRSGRQNRSASNHIDAWPRSVWSKTAFRSFIAPLRTIARQRDALLAPAWWHPSFLMGTSHSGVGLSHSGPAFGSSHRASLADLMTNRGHSLTPVGLIGMGDTLKLRQNDSSVQLIIRKTPQWRWWLDFHSTIAASSSPLKDNNRTLYIDSLESRFPATAAQGQPSVSASLGAADLTPSRGVFREPEAAGVKQAEHGWGELYLDGSALGRWLSRQLGQEVIRPRTGIMAVDLRATSPLGGPTVGM